MNISIIIPIHKYDETVKKYLSNAVESIKRQEDFNSTKVLIVSPKEVLNQVIPEINKEENLNINFIENTGEIDYQSQVNLAVESVDTDYFTVLEFDDELSSTYIKNCEKYIKNYPEVDIFLTMMIEVNEKNEGLKLTNETVWAQQFVGENGEMGYLNINALKQYTDFKLSGAVIKKDEFKNIGGYKPNIKLTFMYELLLRALNNACKIFTIPKIGYRHLATREDSLFGNYQKNMSIDERKFWFETATKESNFMNDRPIDLSKLKKFVIAE